MERYEKYKDSGIPWLGMIPEHWEMRRIKYIFRELNERSIEGKETPLSLSKDDGLIPSSEKKNRTMESASYVGTKVVHPGNIVFNRFKARLFAISKYDGVVSSDYAIYRCNETACADFFVKLFGTETYREAFNRKASGIGDGFSRLYTDDLFSMYAVFPPLAEQKKIVDYIESKTISIDAYVRERERELRLLDELKQTQIAEAVTHGLNPDVKMKDSGIPWIGMIPEHWEMKKLSQIAQEHFISNKKVHHQNLLSLSYGNIVKRNIDATEGLLPASFDTYQIVEEGNIVLRLTDLQNDHKSLRVGLVKEEGIVTSAYVCLNVTNEEMVVPDYLYNLLHTYDIKKMFYSMGGGIRQNLNWQGLKKIDVPVPPLSEQRSIVDFIDAKCDNINSLISELEAEIAYLKEYKQRLVADAVTGQIKVF